VTWTFHLANAIYLVSYAVKEILWLRLVTVLAGVMTLLAMSRMPVAPPRAAVAWQLVFFTINLARLIQLIHERRPVRLGPDAKRLAASVFPALRPRELLRLLAAGEILDHPSGVRVIRQGEPLVHLAIVIDGTARVELADARAVELSHGAFIGELSYLTGRPPAADVVAASALRIVRWPTDALRGYLEAHPETRTAMQLVLGADLAAKLRGRA
jgi:CRP-like cAMP-binding protein